MEAYIITTSCVFALVGLVSLFYCIRDRESIGDFMMPCVILVLAIWGFFILIVNHFDITAK